MTYVIADKKVLVGGKEASIKINRLKEPINIVLETDSKFNLINKVIELKDLFIDLEFIQNDRVFIMIKSIN